MVGKPAEQSESIPHRIYPNGGNLLALLELFGSNVKEHFYLSNWDLDGSEFSEAIRNHWQVENGLHWVKDVTLNEDYPPRRGGSAPINWAVFNSFLITLIRRLGCRTIPDGIRELTNQVEDVFRLLT